MPLKPFSSLPNDSRLWSFGCSRPLTDDEERDFLARLDHFLDEWRAHGQPLDAGRDWREGRLLLVAVDESTVPPSGCSIDALVHTLKAEEEQLGAKLVDNSVLWIRDSSGEPAALTRLAFAEKVAAGEVGADTPVFDFTRTKLGEVRDGMWETAAGKSWHSKAFRLANSE